MKKKILGVILLLSMIMSNYSVGIVYATSDNYSVEYKIDKHDYSLYDNNGAMLLQQYYDNVVVLGESENFNKINFHIYKRCADFENNIGEAIKQTNDFPPTENDYYLNYSDAEVTHNSNGIFSIKMTDFFYLGGVGRKEYRGLNYNLDTGEVLALTDIIPMSETEITAYFRAKTIEYIKDNPNLSWYGAWGEETAEEIVNKYTLYDFKYYIENNNIVLCYSVYELGAGAMGAITIPCPIIPKDEDEITEAKIIDMVCPFCKNNFVLHYYDNGVGDIVCPYCEENLTENDKYADILNGDFSKVAGKYTYPSGRQTELLSNGVDEATVGNNVWVENIQRNYDGSYSWEIVEEYDGFIDGKGVFLWPEGVEVRAYDGSIIQTDTSKVRMWSGNAEVSDAEYICYKEPETPPIKVLLNGKEIEFDQPPIMSDDRILVPIRKIAEAMGDTVMWNDEYQTAFIKHEDRGLIIKLLEDHIKIVKNEYWTQWEEKELDVVAFSLNGRTLVPVRAFCESLGADVEWNGESYTAHITYDFNKKYNEMTSDTFKNINTVYYALNNNNISFSAYSDDFNYFYNNRNSAKDAIKMGVSDIWAGVRDLLSTLSNSENIMKDSIEQMLSVIPDNEIVQINTEIYDDLKSYEMSGKYVIDEVNGIDDEFLKLHPNLKTLDISIEAVSTAYDILSFSTEQMAVYFSNYTSNIEYINSLRAILAENDLLDDELNNALLVLEQEYSNKFFNVMLNTRDELEKFTITEGTNLLTGGFFSVGEFAWEQMFKLSGITDDGQALKTFYGLYCINDSLDTAYNNINDKILSGIYTSTDVENYKILDDLQKALKIKTYQCIKIISQDAETHSMCDEYISALSNSNVLWK